MKNFKLIPLKKVVVLIAFTFSLTSYAADLYWVNGSGNWNDPSHWSTTSGGSSAGNIPGANDNVFFDDNSFVGESYPVVQINNSTSIHNMSFNGGHVNVFAGSNELTITGELMVEKSFYLSASTLIFDNQSSVAQQINTKGYDIDAHVIFIE